MVAATLITNWKFRHREDIDFSHPSMLLPTSRIQDVEAQSISCLSTAVNPELVIAITLRLFLVAFYDPISFHLTRRE